jgi:hypothetical protein
VKEILLLLPFEKEIENIVVVVVVGFEGFGIGGFDRLHTQPWQQSSF